ncbi:PTS glucose transporter subunit IIA [uncultured Traorella sp.]|uniref:PTS sugar transporter subunit IIA n=1 Tax=uncultured Traorella sp. TaxID=1929048 RepID=UPI0025DBE24C|nr:PTS glucose transporter subunit IIA [uncultured Traorella sp.]
MKIIDLLSPCKGEVIRIEDFPDEIIASKAMGDGLGVNLSANEIVAPFDAVVSSIYPTGHAICLLGDNGVSLMIHIGIDSYKIKDMNKIYVKANDHVKKGDILIKTNYKKLIRLTGNASTAIVFLNGEKIRELKFGEMTTAMEKVAEIEVNKSA